VQQQQEAWGTTAATSSSGDDVLGAIMAAEDDLVTAHRQHIEECMGAVREEMNLLADLDGSSGSGECGQLLGGAVRIVAAVSTYRSQLCMLQSCMSK